MRRDFQKATAGGYEREMDNSLQIAKASSRSTITQNLSLTS
jgi:hypothetical protein